MNHPDTESHTKRDFTPTDPSTEISVKAPAEYAGGMGAIWSGLRATNKQMNPLTGIRCLSKMNQKSGFDCPGCAWPEPESHRSLNEYCENGMKALAEEATRKSADPKFFATYSIEELRQKSEYWLGQQGRLTAPLISIRGGSHLKEISWSDANQIIARHIRQSEHPDQNMFYTSGRTSNEAAFLWQLFARLIGTNNLPDCSNMCHESSGVAMKESIGVGKGTVSLDDFDKADLILVCGQNPGTNHPRMLSTLQKAARNGARIISVNPLREAGLKAFVHPQEPWNFIKKPEALSSLHIPVRPGGDGFLFQALNRHLIKHPLSLDTEFIVQHTSGFDDYKAHLSQKDPLELLNKAGVSQNDFDGLLDTVLQSKAIICTWAMGLTQQPEGVQAIQEILNFLMLRGNLGKPGAGACPVRGHSNVQGDRTMGIHEKPPGDFLKSLEARFQFKAPSHHGHDVVSGIMAMHKGDVKHFLSMGGNLLSAAPDTTYTAEALQKTSLSVYISTKLNRSHLYGGQTHLILPCLARSDADRGNFVTVENSMGVVSKSSGQLKALSDKMKSEPEIICNLAISLWQGSEHPGAGIPWERCAHDYSVIRDMISDVIPGFEQFQRRILKGSITLPHPVRDHRVFQTRSKKAQFTLYSFLTDTKPNDQFLLLTIRSHDQYNTTIYGLNDRYRGIFGARHVLMMNPEDINALGLSSLQEVSVSSSYKGITRDVNHLKLIPYEIPKGCVAGYFPELNPVIPVDLVVSKSNTPVSKGLIVSIRASSGSSAD